MKKYLIATFIMGGLVLAPCVNVFAESVEKIVTGEGDCARCILKEKDAHDHQITITDTAGGNAATYYLTDNNVTREFGHQLCAKPKTVMATGVVRMLNGRLQLTPTKIELVKN